MAEQILAGVAAGNWLALIVAGVVVALTKWFSVLRQRDGYRIKYLETVASETRDQITAERVAAQKKYDEFGERIAVLQADIEKCERARENDLEKVIEARLRLRIAEDKLNRK